MKKILLFLTALIPFFQPTFADESEEKSIYAISSLLFHVNETLDTEVEEDNTPPLVFEAEEIIDLWMVAKLHKTDLLEEAHLEYDLWQQNIDTVEGENALENCQALLTKVWLDANDDQNLEESSSYKVFNLHEYALNNLNANPLLTESSLNLIRPWALPDSNPLAPIMDKLFSTRVTLNSTTFKDAGFTVLFNQPRSFIIVAKHPALPGYLIKLHYDTELRIKQYIPGWQWFVKRCVGAEKIRNVIAKHKMKHFAVPDKYLYVLPPSTIPARSAKIDPKILVLIAQDMQLRSKAKNAEAWEFRITKEALNELYIIMSTANGSSYRRENLPYTKSGKFAFIDTEYPDKKPNFRAIRSSLSASNQKYWDQLVRQGGPK